MQLNGSLSNFTLPELIQMMGGGGKTGLLALENEGRESRLYFNMGNPIHAEAGELSGEEAFYRMFRITDGRFAFMGGVSAPCRTIHIDWTTLMIEAARLLDENLPETAHNLLCDPFFPYPEEEGASSPSSKTADAARVEAPFAVEERLPFDSGRESWEAEPETERPADELSVRLPEPALSFHPHLIEAAERLSERIEASGDVNDFTVISRDGLLRSGPSLHGDGEDTENEARMLSNLLDGASLLGEELSCGKLKCVVLMPHERERRVLFTVSGLLGAATLKAGRKPLGFLTSVTQMSALRPSRDDAETARTGLGRSS